MSELSPADQEIMRLATEDAPEAETPAKPEAKAEDAKKANYQRSTDAEPLELGGEDAPEATDEEVEAEEKRKGRSHSPIQRINTLTARLREAEREAAELRARVVPEAQATEPTPPDPNNEKYEFGMADPNYIKDAALFEVRKEMAEERKATQAKDAQSAEQNAVTKRLTEGMATIEKTGSEKYDDFQDKITEAVEARGGEPLPPLVSVGIAVSPAGADIAYRLATDGEASDELERLALTDPEAAATMFGGLEGQYLDNDSDLNLSDPWDRLRKIGRLEARLKGLSKPVEVRTSKAPEAPDTRARGASGKFEPADDTEDFAAFERKIMGKR